MPTSRRRRPFAKPILDALPQGGACRLPGRHRDDQVERAVLRLQGTAREHGVLQGALRASASGRGRCSSVGAARTARRRRWASSAALELDRRHAERSARSSKMVEGSGRAQRRRASRSQARVESAKPPLKAPADMLAAIKKNKKAARGVRGLQPVGSARLHRVDHRGEDRRHARQAPRHRRAMDVRGQEPQLEIRAVGET